MKSQLRYFILLFLIILLPVSVFASTWAKSYGGSYEDAAQSIQQTYDGGFIVAGETDSFDAGNIDIWVLKLDTNGDVTWQKTYGGSDVDRAYSIQQTPDGGFIVAGYTKSYGAGNRDIWVLKLDANGNVVWQKTYGGNKLDFANSIKQTSDGGFIVAGITKSYGAPGDDIWVLKLDANGNVVWQKTYGGSSYDYGYSIQQTSDGGFIVIGGTASYGAGSTDIWVLKLDANGGVTWQKTYGGSISESARSIQQTSDGGFIVAGETSSYSAGYDDVWVLKLNSNGDVVWQKTYGGSSTENPGSIQQTSDGGFIVVGYTWPLGAGDMDIWALKLNSTGGVTWQKTYGGSYSDSANSIKQTSDGGFILGGYIFQSQSDDFWVLKLNADGNIPGCDIIKDTSGSSSNTTAIIGSTSITPANSSATVTNTSITPTNTSATVEEQCFDEGPLFVDVPPGFWAEAAIYKIYNAGITKGCSQDPLMYCPEDPVTRAQMAVFLGRGVHGSNYTPPAPTGIFQDVPVTRWAANWIEQFYHDGITSGCSTNPMNYCPVAVVTRAQMAIFLLRSKHGSSYTPPAASGIFADVPATSWAAEWMEQLYHEGITAGCATGPLRYCPENSVTRAQMAVFIVRTFGL